MIDVPKVFLYSYMMYSNYQNSKLSFLIKKSFEKPNEIIYFFENNILNKILKIFIYE